MSELDFYRSLEPSDAREQVLDEDAATCAERAIRASTTFYVVKIYPQPIQEIHRLAF